MPSLNDTMRAVLWTGIPYNVTVQDVPMPRIQSPTDALVRMTAAAICGTDLHVYHGIYGSSTPPWIMGHEGMGVVEEVGDGVQSLSVGDTVVIPDLLDTGSINMDLATDWDVGGIIGLGDDNGSPSGAQAEYLVVPFADNSLIPVPSSNTSNTGSTPEQISYLFLSDIFATGWTALTYSGFETGDTVAVFGAGPVGLLSAYSAILRGASRVYVVDSVPSRLDLAESIGAIPISLNGTADAGGPAAEILRREPNGVARSVDCVGYEAVNSNLERQENTIILDMVNVTSPYGGMGTIGVFAALDRSDGTPLAGNSTGMVEFPVADFFNKALSWRSGAVDPKAVAPELEELVTSGRAQLDFIVSSVIGIEEVPEFYARFDQHLETKVIITFD